MQNIKELYQDLTGVNIDEQRRMWDERGKGYYGEFLVFSSLFRYLSDQSKILMNIEIPSAVRNDDTEIDLLLIHESGLYCFEIKHYKGDIYCNLEDKYWVQFFRTAENNRIYSPVYQNRNHIKALRQLFPDQPIYSFIVFTNDNVTLHDGNKSVFSHIETDDALITTLEYLNGNYDKYLGTKLFNTPSAINDIFIKLEPYSKIQQKLIIDGKEMTASDFIASIFPMYKAKMQRLDKDLNNRIVALEADYKDKHQKLSTKTDKALKKAKTKTIVSALLAVLGILSCIVGFTIIPRVAIEQANTSAQQKIEEVESKYADFFSKFEEVDSSTVISSITSDKIAIAKNTEIHTTDGVDDVSYITFTVEGISADYGIALNTNSRLIVNTTAGSVKEIDIFSDHNEMGMILRNSAQFQMAYNGTWFNVKTVDIPDVNPEDITYAKLINTSLFKTSNPNNILDNKMEIEIYKANN